MEANKGKSMRFPLFDDSCVEMSNRKMKPYLNVPENRNVEGIFHIKYDFFSVSGTQERLHNEHFPRKMSWKECITSFQVLESFVNTQINAKKSLIFKFKLLWTLWCAFRIPRFENEKWFSTASIRMFAEPIYLLTLFLYRFGSYSSLAWSEHTQEKIKKCKWQKCVVCGAHANERRASKSNTIQFRCGTQFFFLVKTKQWRKVIWAFCVCV